MQGSYCFSAKLQGADLSNAQLQGSTLLIASMQCANLTTTNFQGADLTFADISGSRLLKCNLYGAKITGTKFVNVMFDTISKQDHIKEKHKREVFIDSIRNNLYLAPEEKAFIARMQDSWDKADNEVIPERLDALHKASILKQDSEGGWIIIPSKISGLKDFYRELDTEIDLEKGIFASRIVYLINNAKVYSGHIENNYSKIEASLAEVWAEIAKEFADKK